MATLSSDGLPFNPRVFDFASNLPTPLNSPSTDYLLSMPQGQIKHTGPSWGVLQDSPGHPPLPPDIMVPDPPTPRSNRSGNDTPTPPMEKPGSSEGRRHNEYVSRPTRPRVLVNAPDSNIETSLYSPSSSGGGGFSEPDDPLPSAGHDENHGAESTEAGDPTSSTRYVEFPPFQQVDGTSGEGEAGANQQPRAVQEAQSKKQDRMPCKKLRKSLRNIPSQLANLFSKDKVDGHKSEDSTDGHVNVHPYPAGHMFGRDFKNSWRSGARRYKQVRKSVGGLFASRSSASQDGSTKSESCIGPAMGPVMGRAHDDGEDEAQALSVQEPAAVSQMV
ncbi:MAG: hypothetical protein LQ346_004363 [Caloplaca aetnensis]|nr:MAG: hypothetical protein LQ346_004363 [Caloplaca aetnensis]